MQSLTGKRTPNAELVNVQRVADIKTTFIMMSTYITCIITDNCGKLIKIKKHQARYNSYKGTQYKIYFNKQSAEQNRVLLLKATVYCSRADPGILYGKKPEPNRSPKILTCKIHQFNTCKDKCRTGQCKSSSSNR
jgi:hypothetical protein